MKHCSICKTKYEDNVSFCPVDGEVLEDDPSSIVDTVLDGQYQMEAMLGKGGMGAVYSARHILLGDRVAIKVLPPEVRNNAEWLRRFRREGQAARRFRHPNAVTVYDLRTAGDGTIYMVMEYVEGHTLDAELKKHGRFTAHDAFDLLTPIMSVLDTAHSMGVVHRDLKPENIMVGKPGSDGKPVIKLLDLGIAKMRDIAGVDSGGNTALTMAGQVLGTPYYMSPEQWGEIPRDGNLEIDGRADIYSLGLVFYEMIAGKRCYSGNTLNELRREHVSATPRPLIEVVPDVPPGFSDAIQRATAKDRADRQSTAGELAAELKAGLGTRPTSGSRRGGEGDLLAETVAIDGGLETNSDVNAPTLIEMNPAVTGGSAPRSASVTTPPEKAATAGPRDVVTPKPDPSLSAAPTMVESAAMASSVTIPQLPKQEVRVEAPKSKAGLLLGAGALVVFLIVAGVVGVIIFNRAKSTGDTKVTNNGVASNNNTTPAAREIGKYWLELEPKTKSEASTKVAGLVPIASGQNFQMHFVFSEDGYVYVVGPGPKGNQPTAFLTSKPMAETGLKTNQTNRGSELSFPSGETSWLTLDRNPGTENYTIIFSKTPLTSVDFLNVPVTGEPLSSTQQTEFRDFVTKYKTNSVTNELDESDSRAPFVRIKTSGNDSNNPLVFDVRIQHN